MIIHELYMKNFGQFSGKKICPEPGINLILGRNEAGKSTAAEFIPGMLFGMKRARGRGAGKDVFGRCTPWNGGLPEGSLRFSCRDRNFCISRRFPDQAELFCTDDGEVLDVDGGDLEMLLGGIREGLYRNTAYAGSREMALDIQLPEELTAYLMNMESLQEEQADVQAAERYLKGKAKVLQAEYKSLQARRWEREEVLRCRIEYLEDEEAKLLRKLEAESGTDQPEGDPERLPSSKEEGMPAGLTAVILALAAGTVWLLMRREMVYALIAGGLALVLVCRRLCRRQASKQRRKERQQFLEREQMERSLYRRHLKEVLQEKGTERENCLEELEELDTPSGEETDKKLELDACADAAGRIREAARDLSGAWALRLEQEASDILNAITEGRYRGLKMGERMDVTVTDGIRVYRPDQLSTGTREQIWMSLRLSAAMLLTEEPIPFLFDDAFLTWDDGRLEMLLRWLSACGRQVLLFTGQRREEELMRRNNLPYCKIVLDEQKEPVYV